MAAQHGRPEVDRTDWWGRLWRPFWVLPAAIALGSTLLGSLLPQADERLVGWIPYIFESGPEGARQLLGTIASAMISVTGLVFSITIVVLQLASSQFTPRLLGQFLQMRVVQLTLGVFTGSFLYSLTVMRLVRGATDTVDAFVPQASVTIAFVYVITSVAFFVAFIHQITQSVHLSHVVASLGRSTRSAMKVIAVDDHPRQTWSPDVGTPRRDVIQAGGSGVITTIDSSGLVRWAAEHDCVVELHVGMGDFVADGDQIGTLWGQADEEACDKAARFLRCSTEPTLWCDHGYGIRQLTDIAERALSPGVNDPTSAVQVINELYAVFRPLVAQPNPSPYLVDDDGSVRAVYRAETVEHLLDGSLVELAHYAKDSPRVLERIAAVAGQLLSAARAQHRPVLKRLVEQASADSCPLPGGDAQRE